MCCEKYSFETPRGQKATALRARMWRCTVKTGPVCYWELPKVLLRSLFPPDGLWERPSHDQWIIYQSVVQHFFFFLFCKSESCFCFFCFSETPPPGLLSTGPTAPTFTTVSPKTTSGMWVRRRSLSVTVWQHRQQIVRSSLSRLLTGCFSAGCDATELPGCAEGRRLKGQRWLRKGVKEASEKHKNKRLTKAQQWKNVIIFLFNAPVFVLAAVPKITCLCTSPTTGRPEFWLSPTMMWVLFLLVCGV